HFAARLLLVASEAENLVNSVPIGHFGPPRKLEFLEFPPSCSLRRSPRVDSARIALFFPVAHLLSAHFPRVIASLRESTARTFLKGAGRRPPPAPLKSPGKSSKARGQFKGADLFTFPASRLP